MTFSKKDLKRIFFYPLLVHIVHNPFGLKGWNLAMASAQIIEDEFSKIYRTKKN